MTEQRLQTLYRRLLASQALGRDPLPAGLDAERLADLAQGKHLGDAHLDAVEALAHAPQLQPVYCLARELIPAAERLSRQLAPQKPTHCQPGSRHQPAWARWAMAASIFGIALLAGRALIVDRPSPSQPVSAAPQPVVQPQPLFSGSFERDMASTGESSPKPIFRGSFDS